ncbi:type II secretion system protein F [Nakamurella sp. YIM 132087]|uniref:Type II secretion system protein F n=1 Tax=Nakamurella alba TaxID=2665158 RepID=A0A7K1FGP0_9ACTN|nr:type II secretion system F family protein [Nakamurella alba]MTD13281.1 type II secretion system protein F [Nakamurella alba]
MGAVIGALFGVGLLLVWSGARGSRAAPRPRVRTERMREMLLQAGLTSVSPLQLGMLQAGSAVVVLLLSLVVTGSVSVSGIFAVFGAAGPRLIVARLRNRRMSDRRELWPEVVDNLTSGVRAGLSLPEALSAVGVRGPEQLREPFRRFGSDYRTSGKFDDSLNRLKAALADPVGDRVCESLRVAREVGGTDLGRLLLTLSGFLREDARTRAELLARQSWSVNAARMAVAAPWLVLVLLATQRETLAAYDSPTGTMILLIGAVLSVAAYRLMVRIGRLPEDRRVLR